MVGVASRDTNKVHGKRLYGEEEELLLVEFLNSGVWSYNWTKGIRNLITFWPK